MMAIKDLYYYYYKLRNGTKTIVRRKHYQRASARLRNLAIDNTIHGQISGLF